MLSNLDITFAGPTLENLKEDLPVGVDGDLVLVHLVLYVDGARVLPRLLPQSAPIHRGKHYNVRAIARFMS